MSWAEKEMSLVNFKDERLKKRAVKLLDSLSCDPTASIPKACNTWKETKAAYRFFSNEKVKKEEILDSHNKMTLSRIKKEKCVLLLQDTSEINYFTQKEKQDVGPSHHKNERIFFLHPTIAVTPEQLCLGVTDVYTWHRKQLHKETMSAKVLRTTRLHKWDISEKESYRWLLGYRHASKIAQECQDTHIIMIADREADISDIYHEAEQMKERKADWLIRLKNIRRVILNGNGERGSVLLYEEVMRTRSVGQIKFTMPKRGKKPSRQVIQSVRTLRVRIHPPTGRRGKLRLQPFWATVIVTTENNPPAGEEPISWVLLTNMELNTTITYQDTIKWYLCRWKIETFFYILKSGCRIEELQLKTAKSFLPCIALYCIVAWRILTLTHVARVTPDITCEVMFEKIEWQCAYSTIHKKPPPTQPPTIQEMIILIAKLGGFLARKSDRFPGPKSIWLGFSCLRNFVMAFEVNEKFIRGTYG